MRVFLITAIAVLSGCHANLLYADAPKPQMELLIDSFWDNVAKATQTADDTLQMIRKSQFGQEVNARLRESVYSGSAYAVSLKESLPPAAQDLVAKIHTEADTLKTVLTKELAAVRESLEPYAEDVKAQIQQRVERFKQELAPYADSLDSESLRTTLMQRSEELKSSLEQSVRDMQAQLGPYTDDLKQKVDQHLQGFQDSVVPMTQKVQVELRHRAKLVKQMVAPYAEDLREKLDPYTQEIQAQLISFYESLVNAK